MKARYLDIRNFRALLPEAHGLPIAQRLENCLRGINDNQGPLRGSIDALIKHNERTLDSPRGSLRLRKADIEIAQGIDFLARTVHTQAIERPNSGPAKLHVVFQYPHHISWKLVLPLQFLLKGWGDARRGHQCYVHTLCRNLPNALATPATLEAHERDIQNQYTYVGITGRNWLQRLDEHFGEVRRGSRKRFHQAWRESLGIGDVMFLSALMDINLCYEDAMAWEEREVDRFATDTNALNMIPGGFKGLKFLHQHRITDRIDISLQERERAVDEYVRRNPRRGIPNPFISELWKDDAFYLRNIGAREKTLSPEQVRKIRQLAAEGLSLSEIRHEVDALNDLQVKNVIAGRTYRRVH